MNLHSVDSVRSGVNAGACVWCEESSKAPPRGTRGTLGPPVRARARAPLEVSLSRFSFDSAHELAVLTSPYMPART